MTQKSKTKDFRDMVVRDVMTEHPLVVSATDSVGGAMAKLIEADVRHLPVVQDGALVGIVSDRDFHEALNILFTNPARGQDHPWDRAVSTLMSSDVISVDPECDLAEAIDTMIDQKVGALPVVEADSDQLVGIVSYIDILRAARAALG
ncbi:MAG TPA: CBS domain-containing protein [Polyangiaceae bacterium]|nr:CBS domain-containing protein [Polyangiaceae bacterium]